MDTVKLESLMLEIGTQLKDIGNSVHSTDSVLCSDNNKDIKINIDGLLHGKIVKMLRSLSNITILSEEDEFVSDFSQNTGLQWIVDPLDGSLNHFRGIPLSCISIALWNGQEPLMGTIYDYNLKQMYTGTIGKGAWLNDNPISASDIVDVQQAILCTGFPSYRDYEDTSLKRFISQIQCWKKVRLLGSAALSLAYLASGRVDGYMEEDIRIWDVAAGLAIVKAAGGEIYCRPNRRVNFVTAVATNGKISVKELVQ